MQPRRSFGVPEGRRYPTGDGDSREPGDVAGPTAGIGVDQTIQRLTGGGFVSGLDPQEGRGPARSIRLFRTPRQLLEGVQHFEGLLGLPELVAQKEALAGEVAQDGPRRQSSFRAERTAFVHETPGIFEPAEKEGVDGPTAGELRIQHRVAQLDGVALGGFNAATAPTASPASKWHMARQRRPNDAASASPSSSARATSSAASG